MKIRFVFDIEAEDLHREGFAYGYVVAEVNPETDEFTILEQGDCYSIQGANNVCEWVKENVIPELPALKPYLNIDIDSIDNSTLPDNIVCTNAELRNKFYTIYKKYKDLNAEFWSDVNFPVETNFLSAIVKDGNGARDFDMPYPLYDLANYLPVKTSRREYCDLNGLALHNPLDDAMVTLYALKKIKNELNDSKVLRLPAISSNQSKPRFVFDVGAQDLQLAGFCFGYVVSKVGVTGLQIVEKGQCYSIFGALDAKEYVQKNTLPSLEILSPYLSLDKKTLENMELPQEVVLTVEDLRERFYAIYTKWRNSSAEVYSSDVNFPVETNFLSAIVEDGKGKRDNEMPSPLSDVASLLDVNISRSEFTGLKNMVKGNPLHHALASSCALYMFENKGLEIELSHIRNKFQEQLGVNINETKHSYVSLLQTTGSPIISNNESTDESKQLEITVMENNKII